MKTSSPTLVTNQITSQPQAVSRGAETSKWFWSPSVFWRLEGDGVRLGTTLLRGVAPGLFPEIYFLAQQGATLALFRGAFASVPREEFDSVLEELIERKVLVDSILSLPEAFAGQSHLFQHDYGDALLYDPELYQSFKRRQLHRQPPVDSPALIALDPGPWEMPAALRERRSHRQFDPEPVSFEAFSRAVSMFRSVERAGEPHRYYPTTGGLCGIDVYLAVKAGRVNEVGEGIYYYHPARNSLHPVGREASLVKEIHHHTNRAMAGASAFTLFLVLNAEVTMPVYGPVAHGLACVEAGIMLATFNHAAELAGLGICPVGLVDFDRAEALLSLKPNHKLLHLAECGGKPRAESEILPETPRVAKPVAGPKNPGTPSVSDLRRFLSETLPDYMVPSDFLLVDTIPLTPNNKVDREALLKLAPAESLNLGTAFVSPGSDLEEAVLNIWRELIHGRDIGVEDNFFDLGGDSMGVAEVHRRIMEEFKVDLPIVKLFQHPTVRSIARFLLSSLHARPVLEATESDRQALAWVRANPNDSRATAVTAKLRARGLI